jgi:hypothetical protein
MDSPPSSQLSGNMAKANVLPSGKDNHSMSPTLYIFRNGNKAVIVRLGV